jgi:hypothetical protein
MKRYFEYHPLASFFILIFGYSSEKVHEEKQHIIAESCGNEWFVKKFRLTVHIF